MEVHQAHVVHPGQQMRTVNIDQSGGSTYRQTSSQNETSFAAKIIIVLMAVYNIIQGYTALGVAWTGLRGGAKYEQFSRVYSYASDPRNQWFCTKNGVAGCKTCNTNLTNFTNIEPYKSSREGYSRADAVLNGGRRLKSEISEAQAVVFRRLDQLNNATSGDTLKSNDNSVVKKCDGDVYGNDDSDEVCGGSEYIDQCPTTCGPNYKCTDDIAAIGYTASDQTSKWGKKYTTYCVHDDGCGDLEWCSIFFGFGQADPNAPKGYWENTDEHGAFLIYLVVYLMGGIGCCGCCGACADVRILTTASHAQEDAGKLGHCIDCCKFIWCVIVLFFLLIADPSTHFANIREHKCFTPPGQEIMTGMDTYMREVGTAAIIIVVMVFLTFLWKTFVFPILKKKCGITGASGITFAAKDSFKKLLKVCK